MYHMSTVTRSLHSTKVKKKYNEGTKKHKDTHMEMATLRLNRPRVWRRYRAQYSIKRSIINLVWPYGCTAEGVVQCLYTARGTGKCCIQRILSNVVNSMHFEIRNL